MYLWCVLVITSQDMSQRKKERKFNEMLDQLPKIRNARLEGDLLLEAYLTEPIPVLKTHDLDDARGKRHKKETKPFEYCSNSKVYSSK